jgi:hypothetical protein
MHESIDIKGIREERDGTELLVQVPRSISDYILDNCIKKGEIYLPDGREISPDQRKKIYATIRDIADHTGYLPEEAKEHLKYLWICQTGYHYISFSDCSVTEAREFINFLLDTCIREGVQMSADIIERSDDVERTLWQCIRHRKCCICGQQGEVHHVDHIGMGYNRQTKDDSDHRKMCLCRKHHTEAHAMGEEDFCEKYHVFGVVYNDDG